MILGIGHDIIEIERVEKACQRQAFLNRYFSVKEIEEFGDKPVKLAGNFATKESVAKAFGTGIRGDIELKDIEVLRNELGAPYVNLYNGAKKKACELEVEHIHVSITNLKDIASSVVILEGR